MYYGDVNGDSRDGDGGGDGNDGDGDEYGNVGFDPFSALTPLSLPSLCLPTLSALSIYSSQVPLAFAADSCSCNGLSDLGACDLWT